MSKILYIGEISTKGTSQHRGWAFERLGYEVEFFDTYEYMKRIGKLREKLILRFFLDPIIKNINDDLYKKIEECKPKFLWFDKPLFFSRSGLLKIKEKNNSLILFQYNLDNPYGPRNDVGWKLFNKILDLFDCHFVPRKKSIEDFINKGAKKVLFLPLAYEPTIHYFDDKKFNKKKSINVSFIGSPYDNRAEILKQLSENNINVEIRGDKRWEKKLGKHLHLYKKAEAQNNLYRETIWKSKINLSFITHSNEEEVAHRSFEIPACGGFVLSQRSKQLEKCFVENKEIVFFDNLDECIKKINYYLINEKEREEIAKNGYLRAINSGYSNDMRIKKALAEYFN